MSRENGKKHRTRHQTRHRPRCHLCGHGGMILDRNMLEPTCFNKTRCRRRQMVRDRGIKEFIKRLGQMSPEVRERWVAAIRAELFPQQQRQLEKIRRQSIDEGGRTQKS